MTRKIAPILHEIVTAIEGIQGAVAGKTFADFQKDWLLRHGAQRAIEIISEASRHVPAQLKACIQTSGGAASPALGMYFGMNITPFLTE